MSAEVLRKAAALMRERAEAAEAGPWGESVPQRYVVADDAAAIADCWGNGPLGIANAAHIASWHPAVALAVADWLDQSARLHEGGSTGPLDMPAALAVARAYLGTDA